MRAYVAIVLAIFFAILVVVQRPITRPIEWEPEKTWVFVAGVLEYNDPDAGFPKEHRQDLELVQTLKERGVQDTHIVTLLDKDATTERVTAELQRQLSKSQPGDWLILYYCGHGYIDGDHSQTYLQTTDASDDNPGIRIGSLLEQIESSFKGKYAIIGADHCNSGGLVESIKARKDCRVGYAAFCSSHVNSLSTGAWTFTENLVNAFRGDGTMDDNNNGLITFAELAKNIIEDMSFADSQMAQHIITKPLSDGIGICKTRKPPSPGIGRRVEVEWEGEWYRALVIDRDGDRFLVNYYSFPDQDNEWVEKSRMRVPTQKTYQQGRRVRIDSDGQWYSGKILKVRHDLHLVSFDDWGTEWNEWVPASRLKLVRK